MLFDQGKFAAAEAQFAVATRGLPSSLAAWYGLGMARYKQERYAAAVEPLEKAAAALPNEPGVHYALAVCYDKTGQPTKAHQSYIRALNAGLKGPERQKAQKRVQVLRTRSAA
jgi:Flp pilus assembly protein TadD